MKRLVYKRPDGSLRIVIPVDPSKSLEVVRQDVERKDPQMALCEFIAEVDAKDLPNNRDFRSCWRHDGSRVKIDPTLEVGERWKRVRAERDRLLAESDPAMMKARDLNQKVNEWASYRQALRDVPTQADPKNIIWPSKPE